MLTASPKEAPAPARSPKGALGPNKCPWEAAVSIRYLKKAPKPTAPQRGGSTLEKALPMEHWSFGKSLLFLIFTFQIYSENVLSFKFR